VSNSLDKQFGDALKHLREAAGKTQEQLSGVPRTYLSELERGLKTPTLDTIVRLAADLGVTPAQLVARATAEAPDRSRRAAVTFLVADPTKFDKEGLAYARDGQEPWWLEPGKVHEAMVEANRVLAVAHDALAIHGIPFFELLGTRNLGSGVGDPLARNDTREPDYVKPMLRGNSS
jgi:transcriptional regulator with XRE-family HTH domain